MTITDEQKSRLAFDLRMAEAKLNASALADFALYKCGELLLGPITEDERAEFYRRQGPFIDSARGLLTDRLTAVTPEPVDPRREKLTKFLAGRNFTGSVNPDVVTELLEIFSE